MARKTKEEEVQAELLRRERETQVQAAQGFIDRLEDRVRRATGRR